jgi:hypothetical protein
MFVLVVEYMFLFYLSRRLFSIYANIDGYIYILVGAIQFRTIILSRFPINEDEDGAVAALTQ